MHCSRKRLFFSLFYEASLLYMLTTLGDKKICNKLVTGLIHVLLFCFYLTSRQQNDRDWSSFKYFSFSPFSRKWELSYCIFLSCKIPSYRTISIGMADCSHQYCPVPLHCKHWFPVLWFIFKWDVICLTKNYGCCECIYVNLLFWNIKYSYLTLRRCYKCL